MLNPNRTDEKYGIQTPVFSHRRPAMCPEVDCLHWKEGWKILVDPRNPRGQEAEYTIRHEAGRKFEEEKLESGSILFTFEAGQICFQNHTTSLERLPNMDINTRPVGLIEFTDTMNENAYQVNELRERG